MVLTMAWVYRCLNRLLPAGWRVWLHFREHDREETAHSFRAALSLNEVPCFGFTNVFMKNVSKFSATVPQTSRLNMFLHVVTFFPWKSGEHEGKKIKLQREGLRLPEFAFFFVKSQKRCDLKPPPPPPKNAAIFDQLVLGCVGGKNWNLLF